MRDSIYVHRSAEVCWGDQLGTLLSVFFQSNSWDYATAALQLLSHLEGDALNVALLVPETQRTYHGKLVRVLSAHYGSPGRLADYSPQFEHTIRQPEEYPSIFAVALETLAVRAFGYMGEAARFWILRDRFIAGQASCELCRHLHIVAPETPIRDIVDRCRVWESHADSDETGTQTWTGVFPKRRTCDGCSCCTYGSRAVGIVTSVTVARTSGVPSGCHSNSLELELLLQILLGNTLLGLLLSV